MRLDKDVFESLAQIFLASHTVPDSTSNLVMAEFDRVKRQILNVEHSCRREFSSTSLRYDIFGISAKKVFLVHSVGCRCCALWLNLANNS